MIFFQLNRVKFQRFTLLFVLNKFQFLMDGLQFKSFLHQTRIFGHLPTRKRINLKFTQHLRSRTMLLKPIRLTITIYSRFDICKFFDKSLILLFYTSHGLSLEGYTTGFHSIYYLGMRGRVRSFHFRQAQNFRYDFCIFFLDLILTFWVIYVIHLFLNLLLQV